LRVIPFTISSYEKFLKENKVMASECKKCAKLWLPPRPMCINCYNDKMEWVELKGEGKLISFTVISIGTVAMINAGYKKNKPYCVGIVEMEEGPRISAQILGVDVTHPDNIEIGTPLGAEFVERGSWHFVGELAKMRKIYLAFRLLIPLGFWRVV
jgi:uncharacterized OB-fold protein